jgi:hypothetical protein
LQTICMGLALSHNPDLCLLSSWDYRREPLAPYLDRTCYAVRCFGAVPSVQRNKGTERFLIFPKLTQLVRLQLRQTTTSWPFSGQGNPNRAPSGLCLLFSPQEATCVQTWDPGTGGDRGLCRIPFTHSLHELWLLLWSGWQRPAS